MSTKNLAVFWHPDVFKHDPGCGCYEFEASPLMELDEPHPDTPDRVINIKSILERGGLSDQIDWRDGRHATREEIERFHTSEFVDEVIAAEKSAPVRIDGSGTVINTGTVDAIFASAGTTIAALDAVLAEPGQAAYSMVRPPGHHASRGLADGNCIFNNLAIAVEHARASGIERIAVIDWDTHHGNGTQSGFFDRSDVFTISMHMPLGAWGENHPETGEVDEIGSGAGEGFNLNVPLPYGTGDIGYAAAMEEVVMPAVRAFNPDLLVIACGQDASQFDQNGRNLLSMVGFRSLGRLARELANEVCDGRLLLCQEGGYAVTYTGFCMYAVAEGILGVENPMDDPLAYDAAIEKPATALAAIADVKNEWGRLTG